MFIKVSDFCYFTRQSSKQSRNDRTPPQTYICSTPTARPGKQQAALLWLPQLSKQTLWAVVLVWAPRQS